jgi:hypothetical protein
MALESNPITFSTWSSHFVHALSLLEVEKLKRRDMVGDTFPVQIAQSIFENLDVHSFVDE